MKIKSSVIKWVSIGVAAFSTPAFAADQVINVYNWSDNIGSHTVSGF